MKACILYHPISDHARVVEEYVTNFERQKGNVIELMSLETKDGADLATLYEIVNYPALLAIKKDGQLVKYWEGEPLPLMDEVAGYLTA